MFESTDTSPEQKKMLKGNANETSETERQIRNNEQKLQWKLMCRKLVVTGFSAVNDRGPFATRNVCT